MGMKAKYKSYTDCQGCPQWACFVPFTLTKLFFIGIIWHKMREVSPSAVFECKKESGRNV